MSQTHSFWDISPPICSTIYLPACPGALPYTARHSCCSIVPGAVSGKCGCSCCAMDMHACERNAPALQLPSPVAPVMKCWARTGPVSQTALRRFQVYASSCLLQGACASACAWLLWWHHWQDPGHCAASLHCLLRAVSVPYCARLEVCWLSAPVARSLRVRRLVTLHLHTCKRSAAHPAYVVSAAC